MVGEEVRGNRDEMGKDFLKWGFGSLFWVIMYMLCVLKDFELRVDLVR